MDKYKCSCCGGNINRATMTCEYCGTKYKEEYGNVFRIETFQNPVRTLASKTTVDTRLLYDNPKEYSEFAIKQLARSFAECIAPYMDVQCMHDPERCITTLEARIKVVEPINKPTDTIMGELIKCEKTSNG